MTAREIQDVRDEAHVLMDDGMPPRDVFLEMVRRGHDPQLSADFIDEIAIEWWSRP